MFAKHDAFMRVCTVKGCKRKHTPRSGWIVLRPVKASG